MGVFVAEYKGSAMTVNQWRVEEEGLLCLPRLSIYLSKVKLSFLLSPPMSSSLSKTWKSPPLRLDGLEYAWGSNSSPFALGITLHRISSDVIDVVQSSEGDFKLESPSRHPSKGDSKKLGYILVWKHLWNDNNNFILLVTYLVVEIFDFTRKIR